MTSGTTTRASRRGLGTKLACLSLSLLMLGVWGVAGTASVASAAGTQSLDAPTGLAPDGGTTAGPNPVLTWSPVSGATYYKVSYPRTDGTTQQTTVYSTSYAPTVDFPASTVNWSVRSPT